VESLVGKRGIGFPAPFLAQHNPTERHREIEMDPLNEVPQQLRFKPTPNGMCGGSTAMCPPRWTFRLELKADSEFDLRRGVTIGEFSCGEIIRLSDYSWRTGNVLNDIKKRDPGGFVEASATSLVPVQR
jgi:hypothetical protein